ncbi:hypothetical protein HOK51_09185 [Candidatus Woesearchaeota archaeon]|jgi:DNA polymerase, archaea type|nr:hypothetical protein [Candidatus Woesearchaeota archaeon]MBT6520003.1 hypothetical protein [Candidatus Woesearchaeota archaeon]MBT7367750.1 hypothetical protein [Candidatus Woesearchaeota archaeon]
MAEDNKKEPKSVLFYPIDFKYRIVGGKAIIYIYGRTKDGQRICIKDPNFEPYFYIIPEPNTNTDQLIKKAKEAVVEKRGFEGNIVRTEMVEKKFKNQTIQAIKAYANIPRSVPHLRKEIRGYEGVETILEYDILFARRYILDKHLIPLTLTRVQGKFVEERNRVPVFEITNIEPESSDTYDEPKILAFDIEVYNPRGKVSMPEKFPIVMLSLYGKNFKKVITWKKFKTNHNYIEFVDGEAELIEKFKEYVEEQAPDLLVGYYSDGFDFPYILTRAEKYKIKLDMNSDYSTVKKSGREFSEVITTGMIHLDIINFIRRVISRKLKTDSLKLGDVATELLGDTKDDVDINLLAQAWDETQPLLSDFAKYNLKDSKLTYELTEKALPNLIELVKLVGQPISAINKMSFSQYVEWFLMRYTSEFNMLIPNRPGYNQLTERKGERVKGAFVFEPKPGLYHNIVVFDFRSLYPTIITAHNISPETINCDCCENEVKHVPIDNKNLWFCKKKKGFFSSVLTEVITRRMRIKEIIKTADEKKQVLLDARQDSLKILANAFYGYLGFFAARWYSKDCARSVTGYGRDYIHKVINGANEKGFEVIYSDTDSIFLNLKGKSNEDAIKFMEEVNYDLPGLMELEYEGFYPAALFVSAKSSDEGAKKKYALIDEDGYITIKGFEAVRRNWSIIAKEVQQKVINILLRDNEPQKAYDHVKDVIHKLRKREVPVKKVIINTQLTKPISEYDNIGPHVAVAKRMHAKGVEIVPGMIISYVVTVGKDKIRDRAKTPDEIENNEYDPDYYINHQIIPAVDRLLNVFGYSKDDLAEKKGQKKLDAFFG